MCIYIYIYIYIYMYICIYVYIYIYIYIYTYIYIYIHTFCFTLIFVNSWLYLSRCCGRRFPGKWRSSGCWTMGYVLITRPTSSASPRFALLQNKPNSRHSIIFLKSKGFILTFCQNSYNYGFVLRIKSSISCLVDIWQLQNWKRQKICTLKRESVRLQICLQHCSDESQCRLN